MALLKKELVWAKSYTLCPRILTIFFSFIDGAKEAQKSGKKGDPLSDYIAYEKAMDYEKQLMDLIWETRGSKGVAKFNEFRKQAKKREVEGKYLATKRKNQILNAAGIFFAMLITGAGGYFMIWFAMQYK